MKRYLVSRMRYSLYIGIMLALLGFVLACGPGEEPTATPTTPKSPIATPTPATAPVTIPSPTAKKGGVLETGQTTAFAHYDGQSIASGAARWLPPGYNNLFMNAGNQVFVCELCVNEQYTLENAGKTIVINIKPGIKFHNGQEMTSADVKYSLDKMMGTADGVISPRCGIIKQYITSIEAPSTYGLRINMSRPSSFVPKALSPHFCSIYPAGTTRDQLKNPGFGSGPFIIKENVIGSHLRYERNPNYFKPGLPNLDAVIMWKLADTTAVMTAFLAGRLDTNSPLNNPPASSLPQLEKLVAEGKMVSEPTQDVSLSGKAVLMDRAPYDNPKVRMAASLASDRKQFGDAVFEPGRYFAQLLFPPSTGFGRPESEIWDVVPGWATGAKKAQEIEQGKKLMAEAGYPNGVDGRDLVDTGEGVGGFGTSEQEVQQAQLAKVGIRIGIKMLPVADKNAALADGNYGLGPLTAASVTGDPDDWLGGYFITGGPSNISRYSSKEFDELFVKMSSELDPAKRKQLVRQMEDILLVRDTVYLAMPGELQTYFHYSYVKNWSFIVLEKGGSNALRYEYLWLDGKAAK